MTGFTPRQRFLSALDHAPVDRPPVWLMRQAGRYLPEYREVRKGHTFLDMVRTPELATEVTLQPLRRFGIDAAILFSDILTIPEAFGMHVDFPEGGPVLSPPLRTDEDVRRLPRAEVRQSLHYVADAVRMIRGELGDKYALLGFSGAPWTLACYMVEGKGSKSYDTIKAMLYAAPLTLTTLLDKLADAVIDYLWMQIEAGADAVQLFDTWAGELRAADYDKYVRPSTQRIVDAIQARGGKILVFTRHPGHLTRSTMTLGADGMGLDWRIDLAEVRRELGKVGGKMPALQGNLDPIELFAPREHIERRVREMYAAAGGGTGWIANLGHGVVPPTPLAGVEAFVSAVNNLRAHTGVEVGSVAAPTGGMLP